MCRPLRENLHFGGNAMYRTLFEGNVAQWLLGVYTYYIRYINILFPLSHILFSSKRNYRFTTQYVTLVFVEYLEFLHSK